MENEFVLISEGKIKESIKEELSKLPIEYQQAISSFGWLKKCQKICEKFNLTETEIHNFKLEVALLLLGLSDIDTLHEFLDNEIGGTGWEKIEDLVIENIMEPIGYVIDKIDKNEITFPTLLYFDDIYKLDLPKLIAKTSLSGKRKSTVGTFYFNYYDCVLDTTFLNAFDTIRIEIAWEEKEIKIDHQGRTLGLTLLSKNKNLNKNQIAFAVESIVQSCKVDGILDGAFSEYEAKDFIEGNKNFLLFDHPNGHDIGIHRNDEVGISVDISITFEDFLKFKDNIN
jgi:hypothetical protein